MYAYVCDFPTNLLKNHDRVIALPHLGASTVEAEDNCAIMVADQVKAYLEQGNITNSVNFPEVVMPHTEGCRIGIVNSNVPNMVVTFGYINASWTLRADLTHEWVCRVLNHMRDTGTTQVTPRLPPALADMPSRLWIDDFSPGYMERVMHLFPRQGDREPWINPQDYRKDRKMFRRGELEDGALQFTTAPGLDEQAVPNPAVKAA